MVTLWRYFQMSFYKNDVNAGFRVEQPIYI